MWKKPWPKPLQSTPSLWPRFPQNVPAEIVAATDAFAAQAQVVDDLVPDAPTPGSVIAVG
jgi:hypothetical protein